MRWLSALLMSCLALPAWAVPAVATTARSSASAVTADPWIDAQLADLNRYAMRYRATFDDELARYQGAPRELIEELRRAGWSDGDIYAACLIARTSGRPCRVVVDAWAADRPQHWEAIATRFGVAPGSNAMARMKLAIKGTYQRSGRPLAPLNTG